MQAAEARALGALAGSAIAGTAARTAELHAAVLARTPARRTGVGAVHDAIARPVYAAVRGISAGVATAAGAGAAAVCRPEAPAFGDSRAGAIALSAVCGLYGDRVEREHAALAPAMAVRAAGRAVPAEPAALAAAFPGAAPRLAVFVHGLCETEAAWRLFAPPDGPATYGERLERDLGHTPVYLRYNTGLPVDENARRLAALLEALVAAWPVDVEELVLVGHSLGGLVVVHACHAADRDGAAWPRVLRHVVCLASPHHGAPLAKGAHVAAAALTRVPETRPFARVLELRSAATRDLRHGGVEEVPFVDGVGYYALSATVTRDAAHPLGRVVGDLLVRSASAAGQGREVPFALGHGHHAGGLTHFHVLNDPAVYRRVRDWLAPAG
jgi:triacylglycerol esterase/lipase EstA (alpha/beta hydrolase family)